MGDAQPLGLDHLDDLQLEAGVKYSSGFLVAHGLCHFGFNNLSGCLFLLDHHKVFVPSSEGQVRAAIAGWGASVVPELIAREHIAAGKLVNIAPKKVLPIQLYWHCWNLESDVLDALTRSLLDAATASLVSA